MTKIIWTGLPHDVKDGKLTLSVFVSMRLTVPGAQGYGVLADFPTVLDWPRTINAVEFQVQFASGPTLPAEKMTGEIDARWWKKLFTEDTPVKTFSAPDYSNILIRTLPVKNVLSFINDTYTTVAAKWPVDHPSIIDPDPKKTPEFIQRFQKLITLNQELQGARDDLDRVLNDARENSLTACALAPGVPIGSLDPIQSDFLRAHRFYYRPEQREPLIPGVAHRVPDAPAPPRFDFHEIIALLGNSPDVLRLLGLIIDLQIDLDPTIPLLGELRVLPSRYDSNVDVRPRTRYRLTEKYFLPEPLGHSLIRDGMLALDQNDWFNVYQMDLDGAALKMLDFAANLAQLRLSRRRNPYSPTEASLPSLRSGGISVARNSRAVKLVEKLDLNTALNVDLENDNMVIGTEELLRGYRVDVYDSKHNQWYSLLARRGEHTFLGSDRAPGEERVRTRDEGYIKATAATSTRLNVTDPNNPNRKGAPDLYLHEALFGWDGWSLAAPRPGKIIVEPGEGEDVDGQPTHYAREEVKATPDIRVLSVYSAARGTLPRLRFGNTYRIRARAVDLAGNSLPFIKDDGYNHASDAIAYLRYEPVSSPAMVRQHPDTEGESLEHLVIRSNVNQSAEEYSNQQYVVEALSETEHKYAPKTTRHVAPPKTSQLMAEQLGMFASAFGPTGDASAAFNIALREEGSFLDPKVVDITTGEKTIDVMNDIGVYPKGTELPKHRGDVLPDNAYSASNAYIYRKGDDLLLPYLPDPLAKGVVFYNLPGMGRKPFTVWFEGEWPEIVPFRIQLVEGDSPPRHQDGVLSVYLPKADRRTVRYSSLLDDAGRSLMAVWRSLSQSDRETFIEHDQHLLHWMIAPFRRMEVIHAVQQPLEEPEIQMEPLKTVGDTYVTFTKTIKTHAKSTSRLDVFAEWAEPVDRVSEPAWITIAGAGHAFGFEIAPDENDARVTVDSTRISRHEFGDTKHRWVEYYAVATSRFREYFHPKITSDPANIQRRGPKRKINVPSSARPTAPTIRYIVPTFGWSATDSESSMSRERKGGGLRVYLERPWFSSGEGEMLGVVLPQPLLTVDKILRVDKRARKVRTERLRSNRPPGVFGYVLNATYADKVKPYVTQYGKDPIWKTGNPHQVPRIEHFKRACPETSKPGLTIAEVEGPTVAVAAHKVEYDIDRHLWFCDIEIDAGESYFPFVRLALARYQPDSIENTHLSPIRLAEFMQLTADRTATVTFLKPDMVRIVVHGTAAYNIASEQVLSTTAILPDMKWSRRVSVTIEERLEDIRGDLGWQQTGDEIFLDVTHIQQGEVTWQQDVRLPGPVRDKGTHRLQIKEYEYFFTDFTLEEHAYFTRGPGMPLHPTRSRIVYADNFEL